MHISRQQQFSKKNASGLETFFSYTFVFAYAFAAFFYIKTCTAITAPTRTRPAASVSVPG